MADIAASSGDTVENPYSKDNDKGSFRTAAERDEAYMKESEEISDKDGSDYLSATGSSKNTTSGSENSKDPETYLFGDKGIRILGLPLFYSQLDDPNNRVYRETFESDLPVLYIIPGRPILNKKLLKKSGIFSKAMELLDDNLVGEFMETTISLFNIKNFNDLRFISFKEDYSTYFSYLQTVLTFLHASMGIDGTFKLEDWYSSVSNAYGLAFYLDKSTSASDNASNEYGASSLANEANQKSGQIREYKQFLGMGNNGGLFSKIASGVGEIISGLIESVPVVGGLVGSFGKTLQGSQLYYPDIWQNSTFSRSYTLSFKFYSPYGDPYCIFKYVYVPTMALMCLSLPPMDGIYAYKQPFLVRMSCPGYFECECGAITSFDMKRSEDFLWTTEGLPNEISISMTVQDLYPNMIMPIKVREFRYNAGMTSFIECMAGIRFDQLDVIGSIKRKFKITKNRWDQALSFQWLDNKVESTKYNIGQTLKHNFLS